MIYPKDSTAPLSPAEQLRYARHLSLPEIGLNGQRTLRQASVLVIGAGGLGAPALLYLAAAGVGRLGIMDPDCVELSNLQRQILYTTAACGHAKVEVAHDRLLALNPHLQIESYPEAFTLANAARLIAAYDVIIEGSDQFATKYLVNDACVLAGKPYIGASIRAFSGMLAVYAAPDGPCYRCLFPEIPAPETIPSCAQAGVLGTVPGLFGVLQAHEAIKLILGIGEPLIGALMTIDLLAMRFQKLRLPRDPECPVCGDAPMIRTLAETPVACLAAVNRQKLRAMICRGSVWKPVGNASNCSGLIFAPQQNLPPAIFPEPRMCRWIRLKLLPPPQSGQVTTCCSIANPADAPCKRMTDSRGNCQGKFRCCAADMKHGYPGTGEDVS